MEDSDSTASFQQNCVDFNTLTTAPDPSSPHLRPMWFRVPSDNKVRLVEAEVDTGAGCNAFPLYLYKSALGETTMEAPTVTIKAFGDQPVHNMGSTMLGLCVGEKTLWRRFQVCDVRKHPIIGRDLAQEMGYIQFPKLQKPAITSDTITEQVYRLHSQSQAETTIMKPQVTHQSSVSVIIDGKKHTLPLTKDYVMREFEDVFSGMGELPGGDYNINTIQYNFYSAKHMDTNKTVGG